MPHHIPPDFLDNTAPSTVEQIRPENLTLIAWEQTE